MSVLDDEEKLYGTMVRLKVREKYHNLVLKMRKYMIWAEHNYNFKYILKVDDDVYHNPQRLSWAVREWESEQADYIGCFLWGIKVSKPVTSKWFEPNAQLLGPNYFTYPAGPTYALSFKAVQRINFIPDGWLRFFGCGDDCSIGSWLLALNVTHKDDSRLCSKACDPSAITVRHGPGLSNPNVQLPLMHKDDNCRGEQQPPGQPPDVRGAVSFDFSNTNCYQLLEPWDTSFDLCLSNHYTRNMNNTRTS
uniref:Hexosyltransferase n=1 Tax=Tetraselmis sp. GSL018 TaxID=582737 RepID=A0A061SCC1_9CHLO|mmetsp:Transcript_29126/g.69558  ORF Transcript_29126/g.69558 Transcript_29126/m.69558 type:complete len:249 (-) Transcript_29126:275-1021(-)